MGPECGFVRVTGDGMQVCDKPIEHDGPCSWDIGGAMFKENIDRAFDRIRTEAGLPPRSVLAEADGLIFGPRQADYGHPRTDFTRTGRMWAAILGIPEVTAAQVGLCMAALKISREVNHHKRDNLVDAAGYIGTVAMIEGES